MGYDPDWWHPELKDGEEPSERPTLTTLRAKLICASCPVVEECLADSLISQTETYGVWGGLTRDERLSLLDGAKVTPPSPASSATLAHDMYAAVWLFVQKGWKIGRVQNYLKVPMLRERLERHTYRVECEPATDGSLSGGAA